MQYIPGQRWISDTELQMGLGTVLDTDHRSVTVVFLATGETRTYAKETAPLTRVRFAPGDTIISHEGWKLHVTQLQEKDGHYIYLGKKDGGEQAQLHEGELDNFIQLSRPSDRLFSGQIDQNKWFELRYQTLFHTNVISHSPLRGLTGGRTSLIAHQLYIAHEVANRYAPRVLLADEVGLGKTIEAGLILHQQLITERANRVLIIVPETLVHQWLVEMIRRFNLHFSVFDEERCLAEEESATQENPFDTEQLILCSLDFLVKHPNRAQQAQASAWDLMIVDEAHHLAWSEQQVSTEYRIIEDLAAATKGVLLLTATPEQLGKESHFARLRLLDSSRFPDFDSFIKEEAEYEPVAQAVEELLTDHSKLSKQAIQTLESTIEEGDNQQLLDVLKNSEDEQQSAHARDELVAHLLDRHGTGRVLFRNTRSAVKGFPQRQLHSYPLELPQAYASCLAQFQSTGVSHPQQLLSPEQLYLDSGEQQAWTEIDPRIDWLEQQLKSLKPEKVLVIAAHAGTALDIVEALRVRQGIHAAVFHEGMSIVERDRAAAYFADQESGTQVLVCSEIGSEGRNFQFSHHLILFDLPLNPDLLEQRIGRLDRIGQSQTIQIHVPFLLDSPQAVMVPWYHEGLNAFEQTCPAGHSVFVQVEETLLEALHQYDEGLDDLPALIETTQKLHDELNQALHKGRDRLLEYNSCRPGVAQAIKEKAQAQDLDVSLQDYLENVFDCFGMDLEIHSRSSQVLYPSKYMDTAGLNTLGGEAMTITYDRDTALSNENMHFISWEHPLVSRAMDNVLTGEQGNTAVTAVKYRGLRPGTLLLECIYLLESASTDKLQTGRYLPKTTIRLVVDQAGNDYSANIPHEQLNQNQIMVDQETAVKVVRTQMQELRQMINRCDQLALSKAPAILKDALQNSNQTLEREINRLKALHQVNPNVRTEEIKYFEEQRQALHHVLESASPRLDALRVIVAT